MVTALTPTAIRKSVSGEVETVVVHFDRPTNGVYPANGDTCDLSTILVDGRDISDVVVTDITTPGFVIQASNSWTTAGVFTLGGWATTKAIRLTMKLSKP